MPPRHKPAGSQNHNSPASGGFLFFCFLALIVCAPLPLGSNRPWAWGILEVLVFAVGIAWLYGYARGRHHLTPVFRKSLPVVALFAVWLLYVGFQLLPLPAAWVEWLSPEAARMHALALGGAKPPQRMTLSVDPYATRVFWLKSFAYVLVFTLALLLVDRRGRLRQLAYALVFSGLFQALYGSLMSMSGIGNAIFAGPTDVATGTYMNRNHLAGYLEMTLAVGIGLLIASLGGAEASTWRQRLRDLIRLLFSAKMRLRVYLAVMVIALVLTHSRMGNTAFFASLLIAGVIGLVLSRHATRSTLVLLTSLIIIDLFIVGTWFGVEKVAQRLEETTLQKETRDEVDTYSLVYWRHYRWVGSGGGSFYAVFPRYRQSDVAGFNKHAHNDYLELASETGAVGVALLGLIVAASLATALVAQYRRRDPLMRGMGFAGVMGITALLIHSAVDFNLQIPANAVTFMLILALSWLALWLERRDDVDTKHRVVHDNS